MPVGSRVFVRGDLSQEMTFAGSGNQPHRQDRGKTMNDIMRRSKMRDEETHTGASLLTDKMVDGLNLMFGSF